MKNQTVNFPIYASVWKRFISYFIDIVCICFLSYIGYLLVQIISFFIGVLTWSDFISRNWYFFALAIFSIVNYFYFTILPSTSLSSTIGQLLLGIKQIDKAGNPLSFSKSNLKYFLAILSKIFYIGYLFVYFNSYHQTFHEMLTGTYLVER